ncbi:extracellular solute-binding protein [Cohnella sp. GCM10027633]|uniref:extracellular solute-binding protein n=1 Tax=unclassified Cohnella TaxID=2636738 RepID=UPI00364382B7
MKKQMSGLLACLLLGTVLSACASNNDNEASSSEAPSPEVSASPSASEPAASESPQAGEKFEVSLIKGTWEAPIPQPDDVGSKMISERFNIDFKPQLVPFEEYDAKLPVVMAAGDLPDVIGQSYADTNFVKWAEQGAFMPLNDYVDKFETFKLVPDSVWEAMSVDGKIYGIPQYFSFKYGKKPVIRKDWLDNLGLAMPTNYEELKKVAIAFTKDDPDKNGKNDTLGLGIGKDFVFGAWMGTYWDTSWSHRNEQGQLIPGVISQGFKEQVQLLRDLYQESAIPKDWAVTNYKDVRKDFYAGKIGIWYEQPGDNQSLFQTLQDAVPGAEVVMIPPFKQPDGNQGFTGSRGYYELISLNAKLADEPEKVERILGMYDYFQTFIPVDQRIPSNTEFNWQNGLEGKGYNMVDGTPVPDEAQMGLSPNTYILRRGWAPTDEATELGKLTPQPLANKFTQSTIDTLKNIKFYVDPINSIHSKLWSEKEAELLSIMNVHHTKMILGDEPISDWDKAVSEFLSKGGQAAIDDVNKLLSENNITPEWK